jgi:dihydrofolate reductase
MNSVFIAVSIDGYIAREDGDIEWLTSIPAPPGEDYGFKEFMNRIDAVVMGRGTYEVIKNFPEWYYSRHVYVLSSKLKEIPDKLKDKASLLSLSPGETVKHLNEKGLTRLYIDGGKTIQGFLKEDLIDEMIITRIPILLGGGIPLFGKLEKDITFEQVETTTYPNGLVKTHYRRIRK